MLSAAEVTAMFRYDMPDFFVGTVLCTIGLGFAILGARSRGRALAAAGLFAFLYGARMLVRTGSTAHLLGDPAALPYVTAAFEYLVPIPASIVFVYYLGDRWRRLNQLVVITFVAVAVTAIPYEIVARRPHAANPVVNGVVIVLMGIFLLNFATQPRLARNIVSAGALVFGLFVINEHFQLVSAPLRLAREPIGFLIFVGTILYDLLRRSERAQWRLAAVESELATARRIQESILPRAVPAIGAVDVASVYIPASTVAGDYYDFIEVDGDCFGVVVADVSGHGVGAALVASMLKVAIAMQVEHVREPARLLEELNTFFCGKLARQFITAVIAFIDTGTGHVSLAAAGHPPPLVRRAGGAIEETTASGFVLGRMRAARYQDVALTLAPGDTIVFYTDGVTEARRRGEDFGTRRLEALVAGATSAAEVAAAVASALKEWCGEPEDDVTLVAVRLWTKC